MKLFGRPVWERSWKHWQRYSIKRNRIRLKPITLSGFSVDEITIEYSGLRSGEKMYEELLNENEVQKDHVFPKIFIGKDVSMEKRELYEVIEDSLTRTWVR